MTKDTLVIIIGMVRAETLTWESFHAQLLQELNADLALCVRKSGARTRFHEYATYIWEYDEPPTAEPLFEKAAAHGKFGTKWSILKTIGGMAFGHLTPNDKQGIASFLYFYRWYAAQKIIENGLLERYDWFVLTRSDFLWRSPHPHCSYLDFHKIYIPNGENYNGINDRHLICSKIHILTVLGVLNYVLQNPEEILSNCHTGRIMNIESMLKYYFDQTGLTKRLKTFPYVMCLARSKDGHTSWSTGQFDPRLGYCIKYPSEYEQALINAPQIQHPKDWKRFLDDDAPEPKGNKKCIVITTMFARTL